MIYLFIVGLSFCAILLAWAIWQLIDLSHMRKAWKSDYEQVMSVSQPMADYKATLESEEQYSEEGFARYLASRGMQIEAWRAAVVILSQK